MSSIKQPRVMLPMLQLNDHCSLSISSSPAVSQSSGLLSTPSAPPFSTPSAPPPAPFVFNRFLPTLPLSTPSASCPTQPEETVLPQLPVYGPYGHPPPPPTHHYSPSSVSATSSPASSPSRDRAASPSSGPPGGGGAGEQLPSQPFLASYQRFCEKMFIIGSWVYGKLSLLYHNFLARKIFSVAHTREAPPYLFSFF